MLDREIRLPSPRLLTRRDWQKVDPVQALRDDWRISLIYTFFANSSKPFFTKKPSVLIPSLLVPFFCVQLYQMNRAIFNNIRQKNDALNAGYAGFISGFLAGGATPTTAVNGFLTQRSLTARTIGTALVSSAVAFLYAAIGGTDGINTPNALKFNMDYHQYTGEKSTGFFEVVPRRPLSQTVEELGVGRGVVSA